MYIFVKIIISIETYFYTKYFFLMNKKEILETQITLLKIYIQSSYVSYK